MQVTETPSLTAEQKEVIYRLWNQEYPVNVSFKALSDFDDYLNNLTDTTHYLLKNDSGEIEGWAVLFTRDEDKWFAIILDGKVKGQGKGTLLLNNLKEKQRTLYGWVVEHNNYIKQSGQTYTSPLRFYLKNGFTLCSERLETQKLTAVKIAWER